MRATSSGRARRPSGAAWVKLFSSLFGSRADAIIDRMSELPAWFAKTLTWDRGLELAQHQRITDTARIQVYFADPYSPW